MQLIILKYIKYIAVKQTMVMDPGAVNNHHIFIRTLIAKRQEDALQLDSAKLKMKPVRTVTSALQVSRISLKT
jgi:hypothetical protein